MTRLSKSDQHILRPATPFWLTLAIIRMKLRESERQLTIPAVTRGKAGN